MEHVLIFSSCFPRVERPEGEVHYDISSLPLYIPHFYTTRDTTLCGTELIVSIFHPI